MLRQARALRDDERRSGHDETRAVWTRDAGVVATGFFTFAAMWERSDGGDAGALEALRSAAAASFPEVARVLDSLEGAEEGEAGAAPAIAALALPAADPASPAMAAAAAASAGVGVEASPVTTAARVCAACGSADPPLMCGGCRGAPYCSAACQKRDWRAHKAACKQRRGEMMSTGAAAASAAAAASSAAAGTTAAAEKQQ